MTFHPQVTVNIFNVHTTLHPLVERARDVLWFKISPQSLTASWITCPIDPRACKGI